MNKFPRFNGLTRSVAMKDGSEQLGSIIGFSGIIEDLTIVIHKYLEQLRWITAKNKSLESPNFLDFQKKRIHSCILLFIRSLDNNRRFIIEYRFTIVFTSTHNC